MQQILTGLNDIQRQAIECTDQHILVIAAPGSGKTLLLSRRLAYLIKNRVSPDNILAVTFTNKAAKEMKKRIKKLIGPDVDRCWIGTFHGTCLRMIAQHWQLAGLQPGFTIIDDKDQHKLVVKAMDEVGDDRFHDKPESVINKISLYKNKLITPQEAIENKDGTIAHIYYRYQELLKENNVLDFDEIQVKAVRLLENHHDLALRYQDKFKFISVDEIQDICDAQFRIIQLLTGPETSLFSVGDTDQGIYSFRSANIENVQRIQETYGATVIRMEQNYRSSQTIVTAANSVIDNNPREFTKEIWTDNKDGLNLICYTANDEQDEAEFVTTLIQKTIEREPTRTLSDFTILYRTNSQSRAMEEVLLTKKMNYQLIGNVSFFQRKEIKDMVAYLKIIVNKYDSLALNRVINVPKRNIGDTTVKKIADYARQNGLSFPEALPMIDEIAKEFKIGKKTTESIHGFMNSIEVFRTAVATNSIVDLISLYLEGDSIYRSPL